MSNHLIPKKILSLPFSANNMALHSLLLVDNGYTVQQSLSLIFSCQNSSFIQKSINLTTELVYGFLRTEPRIVFILSYFLKKPGNIPRPMYLLLGLSVYSLLFLNNLKQYSIIYTVVDSVHYLYDQRLASVANAVLRSVQRNLVLLQHLEFYMKFSSSKIDALSIFYGIPLWIVKIWLDDYGFDDCIRLMQRSLLRPWRCLRVNALHPDAYRIYNKLLDSGGISIASWGVAFAPGCMPLEVDTIPISQLHNDGVISYQSAGSQIALDMLHLDAWTQPVWDVCAGFGGKTFTLLEQGIPVKFCTDLTLSRLSALPLECQRLHLSQPVVSLADASHTPISRWYGHILVDAPCSGLGVLARRPDIRRRSCNLLSKYVATQKSILSACLSLLQPGMQLAYITCTLRKQENDSLIESLLHKNTDLQLLVQWQTPHDHPWLEGMYCALLKKNGGY